MHTLEGVSADNDVAEFGTVAENEDGVLVAGICIAVAWMAAVVLLVATVERAADRARAREGDDVSGTRGNVQGLRSSKTGKDGSQGSLRELHCECADVRRRRFDSNG